MADLDLIFKVITVGNSGVGKTALIDRCTKDEFDVPKYKTRLSIDFQIKYFDIKEGKVKLQIFDTWGQERYRALTRLYYRQAEGILLTYDVAQRSSFDAIAGWMSEIKQNIVCPHDVILVGNKIDLDKEREVSPEEGRNLAKEYGILFIETSCKYGVNVSSAFETLSKIVTKRLLKIADKPDDCVGLSPRSNRRQTCC